MVGRYSVVALCGDETAREDCIQAQKSLEKYNQIVVIVGFIKSIDSSDSITDLDIKKIDLSDSIFIVNVNDIITDGMNKVIQYAQSKGKRITYMYTHK